MKQAATSEAGPGEARLLAAALDQADVGQIILGPGARVVSWNEWMEHASGISSQEAKGRTLTEIFPESRGDRILAAVEDALERGMSSLLARSMSRSPLPLRSAAHGVGPRRPMEQTMTAKPISVEGLPPHCLIQIFDITAAVGREELLRTQAKKLRRVAQELAHRNEELSEFVFVAHHALRRPLRSILVYVDLLATEFRERLGDEGARHAGVIRDAALRIRELIDDVIEFWKSGRQRGEKLIPVACNAVLEDVVEGFAQEIEESGARVSWGGMPVVRATRADLRQVFARLIANALRFRSEEAPEIRVAAVPSEEGWRFSVADNGIGFEPEYAERIFGLFHRLDAAGEPTETGVGLAIVRRIVERLGGRAWAESQPGRGSTFYFTLPEEVPGD